MIHLPKNVVKRFLYKLIFCSILGWSITGSMDPNIRKCVLMVLPHTSWQDFFVGLFSRGIIGLDMHFVAKKEFFRFPFGWWFRWMGGAPIDRSKNANHVDAIARVFEKRDIFRMAIAPEGTRGKVSTLKSGFYYIALSARVPIIPVAFDYGKKEVRLGSPLYPTGNYQHDLEILSENFRDTMGKFPQKSFSFPDRL